LNLSINNLNLGFLTKRSSWGCWLVADRN